jgi:hypothetical protein
MTEALFTHTIDLLDGSLRVHGPDGELLLAQPPGSVKIVGLAKCETRYEVSIAELSMTPASPPEVCT